MTTESFDISALLSELTEAEARVEAASLAVAEAQRADSAARKRLKELRAILADPQPHFCEVSDHAVLRYAERRLGLVSEEIRQTIRQTIGPAVKRLGDGRYPIGDCSAVVRNGVVVTVVPM